VSLGQPGQDAWVLSPASRTRDVPPHVEQPYFDLDAYLDRAEAAGATGYWNWQLLPSDLIYKSYLAGIKEPRSGTVLTYLDKDGWVWDGTLGARVGLLRYGDRDPLFPQGFQLDAETAAMVRLDIGNDVDVRATDYRCGFPLTYGYANHQTKLAYYHISSHLGDEFLLRYPDYPRLNWARDALALGHAIHVTETIRVYGEVGYAFHSDVSRPWEFQFGVDWAPKAPTGFRGAPFLAVNGHLREEVDFSGNFTIVTGWAWVSDPDRRMVRLGVQYYNGKSSQYSFYDDFEEQIGLGFWYDF
jgi:hypothetical protein